MRDRYFVAYIGSKNDEMDLIIQKFQSIFKLMNVNYCIIMTTQDDEVYMEEMSKDRFIDISAQMN